jgi:hypothetical protein
MAKRLVDCIGIKENKLEAFIPARVVVKRGIIRGIPMDFSTEDLLERIRVENPSLHITGARRLQMLQRTYQHETQRQSETAKSRRRQ